MDYSFFSWKTARKMIYVLMAILTSFSSKAMDEYNEFVSMVSRSCTNPELLLTAAFTNDVITYRATCTNSPGQCAADLALAISLMHMMDCDEACVANDEHFRWHQNLMSNIVYCSDLGADSWIKYAAAVEYMIGLNYGNQQDMAFNLSTNMVAKIVLYPPDMATTNFWNSMTIWMKSPNETLATVFCSNAAIWLAEHNRTEEMAPFTNSLPVSAINILQDELE